MDDIVVWGTTKQEHDRRLLAVLETVRESGLKLNKSKCEFGVQELTYLGEKLSCEGVQPDPRKVEAITNMPRPKNKTELQRALGMLNFLARFVPHMSLNTTSLRKLLRDDIHWQLENEQECEWQALREIFVYRTTIEVL